MILKLSLLISFVVHPAFFKDRGERGSHCSKASVPIAREERLKPKSNKRIFLNSLPCAENS